MKIKLTTTLNELNKHKPCKKGWRTLRNALGADYPPDKEINLLTILESNGVADCIWALRATLQDSIKITVQLAIEFSFSILEIFEKKYPNDDRPRQAIVAARNWIAPLAKAAAEAAAKAAAKAAADDAYAAKAAAYAAAAAAYAAADAAAKADAKAAAYAPADAVAKDPADAPADAAAKAAADAAAEAADAPAYAAAEAVADAAAYAAEAAAEAVADAAAYAAAAAAYAAADDAYAAAKAAAEAAAKAERDKQKTIIKKLFAINEPKGRFSSVSNGENLNGE
jgi:hypothetical protein